VRNQPRDVTSLRGLYRSFTRAGTPTEAGSRARVSFLGAANPDELAVDQKHRLEGLIKRPAP